MRRLEALQQTVRAVWTDEVAVAKGWVDRLAEALASIKVPLLAPPRRRNTVVGGRKAHAFDLISRRPAPRKRAAKAKGGSRPKARHAGARSRT
ncbi:MAG TPA: hypothetical protein VGK67_23055 [Myxococcales bacterium]|jgi:hypothetical protein